MIRIPKHKIHVRMGRMKQGTYVELFVEVHRDMIDLNLLVTSEAKDNQADAIRFQLGEIGMLVPSALLSVRDILGLDPEDMQNEQDPTHLGLAERLDLCMGIACVRSIKLIEFDIRGSRKEEEILWACHVSFKKSDLKLSVKFMNDHPEYGNGKFYFDPY